MSKKSIPAIVLGGSGYVASELLGLLLAHPSFFVETAVTASNVGVRADEVFPHLSGLAGDLVFREIDDAKARIQGKRQVALFSALPHGETAPILDALLSQDSGAKVVDMSADFRLADLKVYQETYGKVHPAPELLKKFNCGLPDLMSEVPGDYVAHPGCFTTGITLGLAGLFGKELIEPEVQVSSVTGSTGAGRQPGVGTHHPHRQSSMWAYQPLTHRHTPEIYTLVRPFEPQLAVQFVPHSGPFSRGIHSTIFAKTRSAVSADKVVEDLKQFYSGTPFVSVGTRMPTLKEIVGTNRCHIGISTNGRSLIATTVIDNLVKGAAGGAVQWMNRMFGLDDKEGLVNAVPGWI